jgi:hypothetical protein
MHNNDLIHISFAKWEEYQPRKDYKSLPWFRVNSDIFDGQTYFNLKNDGIIVLLFLIGYAAKDNKSEFTISLEFLSDKIKLEKKTILMIIKKLQQIQILHGICTEPYGICTNPNESVANVTNERNERTNVTNITASDFEAAYNLYPLKKGKSEGLKRLVKDLKTKDDLDIFVKSIENYKKDILLNKTESKYIKHFSTFVNSWRDWIDYQPTGKGQFQNSREDIIDDFNQEIQKLKET